MLYATLNSWASAHRGKWGQLTPLKKMDEKLKSENVQKILHNDRDHQEIVVGGPIGAQQIQDGGRPPF